jgi:hypothetical protein
MAYRDDQDALFERAEALQIEVDRLRAELQRERAAYAPAELVPTPPPIPPSPFPSKKDLRKVLVPPQSLLDRVNQRR